MPLHMPTLKKRASASSVASQPRAVEAPMPAKAGTLATLAMLKNMGYRDVWCRTTEVTPDIIGQARAEGWVISDAQEGRVRFTRVQLPPDPRTSTHSRSDSQDSHVSAVSQANSYHTIGHRSDTSSTSGHRPASSASSRYSQDSAAPSAQGRHSAAPSLSGGHDRTLLSPRSPGSSWQGLRSPSPLGPGRWPSPRSPGGVSPSAGLAARTPELRLHSPEGVVTRPGIGPAVDSYFDYSPYPNRLSDLPEGDENSSGTPSSRTRSRPRTVEPEDIERPIFRHSPDPEGVGALNLDDLASWVPRIEDTQTSNSLFTFDRPRTPAAPSSVVSPLELGRRTPWDVDEASFEFDSPGFAEMFARPPPVLRMPPTRNQSPQAVPVSVHEDDDGRPRRLELDARNVAPLDRTSSRERLPILSPRWQCRDT